MKIQNRFYGNSLKKSARLTNATAYKDTISGNILDFKIIKNKLTRKMSPISRKPASVKSNF